jgi:NAD dependent epimerase/dehydratase family enzyme
MGPVKYGLGSPLGSGNQGIPWVHIDDLVALFDFCVQQKLAGIFNANAGNTTNKELMKVLARALQKPFWAPNVPGFVLKLVLGKMASVVLDGLKTSNELIRSKGFQFKFTDLEKTLSQLLKK